MAVIIVFNYID